MSGKFGFGFRIGAGDWIERRVQNGWPFDWDALVAQYTEVGASWAIVNLSKGASCDQSMSYNTYLSDINAPPTAN